MGYWILNESVSVLLLLLWLALNLYLFVDTFCWFQKEDAYLYTRVMLGSTLAWARASAMCLNFNCMLVLLPICRNLMSFLRGTNPCCRRTLRRQLDKHLTFHRMVAYMIGLHTIIHVVAHLVNVERYHMGQSKDADELQSMLSCIGQNSNETYLNPIRSYNTNTLNEVFGTIAGVTGFIITLALILIMTSSTELIRRSFYEVFWYTHHLAIAFFIALIVHGAGQMVRGQTPHSLFMHNISHCKDHYNEWGEAAQCPLPEFSGNKPATWKWVLGPVVLYVCERIIRLWRSQQAVVITKVHIVPSETSPGDVLQCFSIVKEFISIILPVMAHASGVLELHMKKRGFRMEPGQYVFLQCPTLSQLEWHPFTLTSAPEEEYFSVHVRVAGDWTEALWKAFGAEEKVFQEPWKIPRLAVDGPFGAATTDVFQYQVSVCIAAGIGVTPFASVLKSIWYRFCDPNIQQKLEKVYFYWICRDTCYFEWFVDLLLTLEAQMAERGNTHFLSYHLFLTGWDETQAAHIALHHDDQTDVITGLRQKTFYGRPNWHSEFRQIADSHPSTSIGVFFCGPKALSKTLHKMSSLYSSADPRGVCFHYNKESF